MMQAKKFVAALVFVGTLLLAIGSRGAFAGSSGSGATVINVDDCLPLIGGATACVVSKGVVHEVETPSGNTSYVANYRESLRVIENGQVIWEETGNERFHSLTVDEALQELSSRSRFTVTVLGQTFCVQYHLHGTNGEDQFVRVDFCS